MTESYRKAIDDLLLDLQKKVQEVAEIKQTINHLCKLAGEPLRFNDIATESVQGSSIRPDQFYGKAQLTAVKEFLKMKGSAAILDEIYNALIQGGYIFTGDQKLWKRGLSIALSKRSGDALVYIKSNKSFGLPEFYPDLHMWKDKQSGNEKESESEGEPIQEENLKEDNKPQEKS